MKENIEVAAGKLYVGTFKGCVNSGPMRQYICLSDEGGEPGCGTWITVPEAKKLIKALQKCIAMEPE